MNLGNSGIRGIKKPREFRNKNLKVFGEFRNLENSVNPKVSGIYKIQQSGKSINLGLKSLRICRIQKIRNPYNSGIW